MKDILRKTLNQLYNEFKIKDLSGIAKK